MVHNGSEKIKKAALHNLGCKVNAYETDVMRQQLMADGYQIVPFEEKADVYIINTCTVTNIADRKSRQMLHRAKDLNPDAVVVAVGCYAQTGLETVLKDEKIDLCIGNHQKGEIAVILRDFLKLEKEQRTKTLKDTTVAEIGNIRSYDEMQLEQSVEHVRAFIKIQDGCNQFCSYCIIPYARGRVRSRKPEAILAEIARLAEQGYQEFVMTGIHISSYGSEWEEQNGMAKAGHFYAGHLLELLRKISEIPGVARIRLGSLEPRIVTEEFVQALAAIPEICPHFHLSLQSGCDETLKRMNRRYTTEEYAHGVEILRTFYEHPAVTTDVITGFPGETKEEFEDSMHFLEKIGFFEMHVFKYSRRRGTPAAVMPGQLTDAVRSARSDELLQLTKRQSEEFRQYYIGKTVSVLFEEEKMLHGKRYWIGHTPQYVKVAVESDGLLHNKIENVNIVKHLAGDYLTGMLCGN